MQGSRRISATRCLCDVSFHLRPIPIKCASFFIDQRCRVFNTRIPSFCIAQVLNSTWGHLLFFGYLMEIVDVLRVLTRVTSRHASQLKLTKMHGFIQMRVSLQILYPRSPKAPRARTRAHLFQRGSSHRQTRADALPSSTIVSRCLYRCFDFDDCR